MSQVSGVVEEGWFFEWDDSFYGVFEVGKFERRENEVYDLIVFQSRK